MAWILVPSLSMTSSFSWMVILNSMTFGPDLVACSWAWMKGRRDELDMLAGKLGDVVSLRGHSCDDGGDRGGGHEGAAGEHDGLRGASFDLTVPTCSLGPLSSLSRDKQEFD